MPAGTLLCKPGAENSVSLRHIERKPFCMPAMQSRAEPSHEQSMGKNRDHQLIMSSSMSGDGASSKRSRRGILTKNVLADQILVGWRKLTTSPGKKKAKRKEYLTPARRLARDADDAEKTTSFPLSREWTMERPSQRQSRTETAWPAVLAVRRIFSNHPLPALAQVAKGAKSEWTTAE